jgi:His-Xaa-Ser system protein HxsD
VENYQFEKNDIIFKLNVEIFDEICILKTAYMFLDKFYIYLDKDNQNILVRVSPKQVKGNKDFVPEEIVGEFNNELLNQKIRQKVSFETKNIRELILARAMYSSFIDEPEVLQENFENYSIENIAKDWFDGDGND